MKSAYPAQEQSGTHSLKSISLVQELDLPMKQEISASGFNLEMVKYLSCSVLNPQGGTQGNF